MDYEKAYKEALKRAKGFKTDEYKDVAEYIFPELSESEDERIRKALINQFSDYKRRGENHGFGYSNDKILAWLEKQGEQKPVEWSEENEKLLELSVENLTELKDRFGEGYGKVGDCISWLQSLKERYTWKPSDEQIELLQAIVSNPNNASLEGCQMALKDIIKQLKKLREE